MTEKLSWGILGTGKIAGLFAQDLPSSKTGEFAAIGSRTQSAADGFGQKFEAAKCYGSYDALLHDDAVDAVYIALPHPMHAEWAIKAAEAGKHILCEKPLALNHSEAMAVVEAARRHGVFLMEAFMYRCHPQTTRLIELIKEGVIGEIGLIEASFGFNARYNPDGRLWDPELGGGGILDVGCYPVSIARLIAGAARGEAFADPIQLTGYGHIGEESRVDEYAAATLAFRGDILAHVTTAVRLGLENAVKAYGTSGSIHVPEPWLPAIREKSTKIIVREKGAEEHEIVVEPYAGLYAIEVDTVAGHVAAGRLEATEMSWDDTLGNMRALDDWRACFKFTYDLETPERQILPINGRRLVRRPGHTMRYGHVDGVEKPVSRLVMGVDNQRTAPHANVMFDDFFERGGNCFDTAYIYGQGQSEELLGHWIKSRGVRAEVVVLDKGAHTPECYPEAITRQLLESLERLQTDYVDIYMMHRDNPDVPIGEFVDVLDEHLRAGRIRAFGGSNWSIERIEAANEYAKSAGRAGFAAISNNFSLARMVEAPWTGCLAASDPAWLEWLTHTQTPIMPWSSQARGFFTGRADPDDLSDPELVRCWYSDDNFARLERVRQMARERDVLPISVALAYVLSQPFPTFPLIGPRTLAETRTSMAALEMQLTPDEVRWLNLVE